MSALLLEVPTAERMKRLGLALGRAAEANDVFLLEGRFGAGKTTFVQGLGLGLDIPTPIGSPSFVIESQYRGRLVLYHVDLYRLERIEPDLLEALEEHMFGGGVTAVEWADRLPDSLRDNGIRMRFSLHDAGRQVELSAPDRRLLDAARHA